MNYSITRTLPHQQISDCLVLPVLANQNLSEMGISLDKILHGQLSNLIQTALVPELGNTLWIYQPASLEAQRILLVSCGAKETLSGGQFQQLMGCVAKACNTKGIQSICCYIQDFPTMIHEIDWKIRLSIQQFESKLYTFDQFKSQSKERPALASINFYLGEDQASQSVESAIGQGVAIASGMAITKDLANTPANHATPTKVAAYATELVQKNPHLSIEVYDTHHETIQKMGAFKAVSQGSDEPAQFVVVKYTPPNPLESAPIVLVGKGVTFDSGGISLKPSANMAEMKFDMTGAASVLGTLQAISQLELPIPMVGLLPLTENLPNGSALKPGDVITTLSGQTVEVLDTDAEGRLILADALTYSHQLNPAVVIDIATLTGAIVVALGEFTTGLMTPDQALQTALEEAGEVSVDRVWALPLWEEYQTLIDSNVADISNLGQRGAGSITAGCFLARFMKDMRWAHLDIAGTAYISGRNKMATGRPVPLLVQYILDYCRRLEG